MVEDDLETLARWLGEPHVAAWWDEAPELLEELVFADDSVIGVRTTVSAANSRSWRCLEKLGFERGEAQPVEGERGPQYVLHLRRG